MKTNIQNMYNSIEENGVWICACAFLSKRKRDYKVTDLFHLFQCSQRNKSQFFGQSPNIFKQGIECWVLYTWTLSLNATWLCVRQQTVFITQISGAELHTPIIMLARHYQVKLPLSRLCTFIIAQLLCRCRRCRYLSVHVHDLSLFLSSQTPLPAIVVSRDLILVAP
jgi:hypothetical protein